MVVNSLTILHYGCDYLAYSLASVQDFMSRQFCFYTPHPSHGHQVDIPPVETRDELMASIPSNQWDKLAWIDTDQFYYEGQQRDYALRIAGQGAGLVLVVDYDEVWPAETLSAVLDYIWRANSARNWLLNFRGHFWRSFNYICQDDGWPVRVIDTRHGGGLAYIPKELGPVWHFGYAISDKVMKYKLAIHGHKDELRPGWFDEKWSAWPPAEDCHPTNGRKADGTGWWDPKPFDKWLLPELMQGHKWWLAERIE